MNKKDMWIRDAKNSTPQSCARAEDLVTYLYGEASQSEVVDFESHLEGCAHCQAELSSFGYVRESMGIWRKESLGMIQAPILSAVPGTLRAVVEPRRSALAALREFFTLSPVWLRAATAMAVVAFCALAAISYVQFVAGPNIVVMDVPESKINSAEDLDKKRAEEDRNQAPSGALVVVADINQTQKGPVVHIDRSSGPRPMIARYQAPRRTLRKRVASPEYELANNDYTFMPFTHADEEKSQHLRLIDLAVDDGSN
jgi:negative regulator of sigma E activity